MDQITIADLVKLIMAGIAYVCMNPAGALLIALMFFAFIGEAIGKVIESHFKNRRPPDPPAPPWANWTPPPGWTPGVPGVPPAYPKKGG